MSDMLKTFAQNQNTFLKSQQQQIWENCPFMQQLLNCVAPEPPPPPRPPDNNLQSLSFVVPI